MKIALLSGFLVFTTLSSFGYFSHIELTKEEAESRKYDLEVTIQDTGPLLLITVAVPRSDEGKVFKSFSILRIEDGKPTFIVSDLHGSPQSEAKVGITLRVSKEELAKTVIGIEYRQSQLGGNGWEYRLQLDSYYQHDREKEVGGTQAQLR